MKGFIGFIVCMSLFTGGLYAAETLYVQSSKAQIMSQPRFDSERLADVKNGDRLRVLEHGKRWFRVSTDSPNAVEGWIAGLHVAEYPPMKRVTVIHEGDVDLEKKARKRASAVTSAASARGLSPMERKRLSEQNRADYHQLGRMEAVADGITDKEVNAFIEAGEKP